MGNAIKAGLLVAGVYVGCYAILLGIGVAAEKIEEAHPIQKCKERIKKRKKYYKEGDYDYYVVDYEVVAEY